MKSSRIVPNVYSALGQVAVTGVILFLQYAYLARVLGLEYLGAWALVVAISNAAQLGQIGLAATPVRFVSKYRARGEHQRSILMARTSLVSIALIMAVVLPLLYPLLAMVIRFSVDSTLVDECIAIVPIVVFGTWLLTVGNTTQSCLEGCERIDLRAIAAVAGSIAQLLAVFLLVPLLGLKGVAIAFAFGGFVAVTAGLIFCKSAVRLFAPGPGLWSLSALKEMLSYGAQVQLIGVTLVLFLPVTKVLMARYGDLSTLGMFELANRLITQLQSLLVSANRTLLPVFSRMQEEAGKVGDTLYDKSYKLIFFFAFPLFFCIAIFSPTISQIFTGATHNEFVTFSYLICGGCLVNSLSGPAYFSNLGTGHPGANLFGHLAGAVVGVTFGVVLGPILGGHGVVAAYSAALVMGAVPVVAAHLIRIGGTASTLIPERSLLLALSCILGAVAVIFVFRTLPSLVMAVQLGSVFLTFALVWRHPERRIVALGIRMGAKD